MLALLALVAATIAAGPHVWASSPPPGFVSRSGSQLLLDGQPFTFTGLNIYNANSDGWCWYAMGSGSALDDALTSIGANKNVFRAWFFQPLATTGGARDWSAFDHTLSVAAAHGYRVIVTLSDQWGECGAGEGAGETSYFKTRDWYINGYKTADTGMLVSYRDWVAEVVGRYKDSATVLMWQLINEAEVKETQESGCLPGNESRDVLIAWASDVSSLVKSIDPDHLVSLGTIGGGQCGAQYTEYQDVHAIPTIDLCEYHDYSPNSSMPGDQWNGLAFRISQCNTLDKPLFVGEVGVRPSDVGGTMEARAAALQAKLEAQMGAGIDGILAWAWSNLGSTLNNYDIGPNDPALDVLGRSDNCPSVVNPGQENGDGDPRGDACEIPQCVNVPTAWANPPGDDDCDGWTSGDEGVITTNANNGCGTEWPANMNNNPPSTNKIDIFDVNALAPPVFFSTPPSINYSVRKDLTAGHAITDPKIDIFDVNKLAPPVFFATCAP